MDVKGIFNEISGLNPSTTTVSSIGTFVSNISQQISDGLRRDVLKHLPNDTLAYKITMDTDHFSAKQLWVIAYELLKNADYCDKLAKENEELRVEVEYTLARKRAKRAAKRSAKKEKTTKIEEPKIEHIDGEMVKHNLFGIGRLISETETKVFINFQNFGEKMLLKKYVKLEKI
jgi:hypothetical protein